MTGANTKVEWYETKYELDSALQDANKLANKNIFSIHFEGKYWVVVYDNSTVTP